VAKFAKVMAFHYMIPTNSSLILDHDFWPAPDHTGANSGKVERFSARIGAQAQREKIGETEGSLDVEPVVRAEPCADRKRRAGKAL
jgi:hypothetical protein